MKYKVASLLHKALESNPENREALEKYLSLLASEQANAGDSFQSLAGVPYGIIDKLNHGKPQ